MKVLREIIEYEELRVGAFLMLPPEGKEIKTVSIFTHGYTSFKGSVMSFGQRLAGLGLPSIVFDLPGHYLGHFKDIDSLEIFSKKTHYLFWASFLKLKEKMKEEYGYADIDLDRLEVVVGGHSLGALMAFKALKLREFKIIRKCGVFVGFGMNREDEYSIHALQMPLYKDVLLFREQLVSPVLRGKYFFEWLKEEKNNLTGENLEVVFIGGDDDFIAPPSEIGKIVGDLQSAGNKVTHINKKKLPHHMPEMAVPHIASFVKNFLHTSSK